MLPDFLTISAIIACMLIVMVWDSFAIVLPSLEYT